MSLEYAILGFLQYRPLSGDDLKKVFDNSVRHLLRPTRARSTGPWRGLLVRYVEQEIVRGLDRPDRKEYRITPVGQEALRTWLTNPLSSQDLRIAELIQVFFAGQLSDQQALALFERLAAAARATLGSLRPDTAAGRGGRGGRRHAARAFLLAVDARIRNHVRGWIWSGLKA